jgi:hypothetical protein
MVAGDSGLPMGEEAEMAEASDPVRRVSGVVRVSDEAAVRDLLARGDRLDFGCKPTVVHEADGTFSVLVIGDPEVLEGLRGEGFELDVDELREPQADVGRGDRFEAGKAVPRGFGVKAEDTSQPLEGGRPA